MTNLNLLANRRTTTHYKYEDKQEKTACCQSYISLRARIADQDYLHRALVNILESLANLSRRRVYDSR